MHSYVLVGLHLGLFVLRNILWFKWLLFLASGLGITSIRLIMGQEFFISDGQTGLLEFQKERIQKLFDVKIALANPRSDADDAGSWRPVHAERSGRTKVEITGRDHGSCTEARDYIASLSQKEQIYPEDILDRIEGRLHSVKEVSGAHISRSKPDTLVFIGSQEQILKALSLIEETSNIASMHDLGTRVGSHSGVVSLPGGLDDSRLPGLHDPSDKCLSAPLPETKYPKLREEDYMRTTLLGGTGCPRPLTTTMPVVDPLPSGSKGGQRTSGTDVTHTVVDRDGHWTVGVNDARTLVDGNGQRTLGVNDTHAVVVNDGQRTVGVNDTRTVVGIDGQRTWGVNDTHAVVGNDGQQTIGVTEAPTVVDQSDSAPSPSQSSKHSLIYRHMVTLGYKCEQIEAALRKFGSKATMDTVLDHLLNQADSSDPRISSQEPDDPDIAQVAQEEEIDENHHSNLRPIYIDGSNVAMSKGRNSKFDCHGIKLAVDYFLQRGHTKVIAFVPNFRKEKNKAEPTIGQEILTELEDRGNLVFTPSRRVGTKRIVSYDDRYILDSAIQMGGIVVSNDHFRDLLLEDEKYRKVIEEQLLMYTVHDIFMPSQDPLGKHGPSLDDFLKKRTRKQKQLERCHFGVKCTYGAQCKYYHPERKAGARTVTQKLRDIAQEKLQDRSDSTKSHTAPLPGHAYPSKQPLEPLKHQLKVDPGSTTSPLPGHRGGAAGPEPYPHRYPQHPGLMGLPMSQPQESVHDMEMRREFEQWRLERSRLNSTPRHQQQYRTSSNQSSPMNSDQQLGYSHPGYPVPQPSGLARQQQYGAPGSHTPPIGSDQQLRYSHPGYPVPQPSALSRQQQYGASGSHTPPMGSDQQLGYSHPGYPVPQQAPGIAKSPRGSPYSSPNSTGLLNIQESGPYSSNPLRSSPLESSLLQGSHQGGHPGTVPFLPQYPGYATSSGSVLPGGSYHHQHHQHGPSNSPSAGGMGGSGRVFSAGSDPLGYSLPQGGVQRSISLQEGDNLRRTRQNIFNNLSRSYGSDLVRYVMSSYPQETDVNKIVFLLNKQAPEFNAQRTGLHLS